MLCFKAFSLLVLILLAIGCVPGRAYSNMAHDNNAADSGQPALTVSPLLGAPVSVALGGATVLPKGAKALTLNAGFRRKRSMKGAGKTLLRATDQQVYLTKLRYGVTDRFEADLIIPYTSVQRRYADDSTSHSNNLCDVTLMGNYMLFAEKFGDAASVTATGAVGFPTGEQGNGSLAGNGSWSAMAKVSVKKDVTGEKGVHRFETECGYQTFLTEGNLNVHKADTVFWNAQYRYMMPENIDFGLESMLEKTFAAQKNDRSLHDSGTSWFAGPSVNIAFPSVDMWFGIGAFAGLTHDYESRRPVEDIRFDVKITKVWF